MMPSIYIVLFQRNTHQAVLITDEVSSFCILNYGDMMWTTGSVSGGQGGLGGFEAQVDILLLMSNPVYKVISYKVIKTNTSLIIKSCERQYYCMYLA